MLKIGFLLKTYLGDFNFVERLVKSYVMHNVEKIPLFIVVPESDLQHFKKFVDDHIQLYSDEFITTDLVFDENIRGIRPGYINQEIIKLAFWEKKFCENYLCLDSDGEFIRDFFVSDFMYDANVPYTILVEDNELVVDPEYYETHWQEREKLIRKIQEVLSLKEKRILTCHGFAILSSNVLESFHDKFLVPNNITYKDLIRISPYEFSWYNMWLQKDKTIPLYFREHLFKYFHNKNQHLEYLRKGITQQDLARGYLGIVINSNYSRFSGVVSYNDSDKYILSFHEILSSQKEIIRSIFLKVQRNFFHKK